MAPAGKTSSIPNGQYKVVSIAVDLTGKKLIDEICHIGAYYHPEKVFSQYVMPHRDVSRSSVRTHGIRIFTNFGYRVLKDARSMKTLKTKSEYSTLCEFLDWLKEAKGDSEGVLLAFHDNNRENVTPFLMEALNRYKMTDDFFMSVKGFVNVCNYAADQEEFKEKNVTLRSLCRRLLGNEEFKDRNNMSALQCAMQRAKFSYQVLQKLSKTEEEVEASQLIEFGTVREEEMENVAKQRELAVKVRSLRPIFVNQIRKGPKERSRAVSLRRYLIEAAIDYETLQTAYDTGAKDAITEIVSKTQASKREKDLEELIESIFTHFTNGGVKKDINGNHKEIGQGEPVPTTNGHQNGASTSSTETDEEEFEEAQGEDTEK